MRNCAQQAQFVQFRGQFLREPVATDHTKTRARYVAPQSQPQCPVIAGVDGTGRIGVNGAGAPACDEGTRGVKGSACPTAGVNGAADSNPGVNGAGPIAGVNGAGAPGKLF